MVSIGIVAAVVVVVVALSVLYAQVFVQNTSSNEALEAAANSGGGNVNNAGNIKNIEIAQSGAIVVPEDFKSRTSKEHNVPYASDLPIAVPPDWQLLQSSKKDFITMWSYAAHANVVQCAEYVLVSLERQGCRLVESGYLNLSQSAWGCACELPNKRGSIVTTIIPKYVVDASDGQKADLILRIALYSSEDAENAMAVK